MFTPGPLLLLITAFLFALYPEVMLGTHSFFDRDFGLFTYPVAHYAREQLLHGQIPLWNPLSDCGVPFLAQWNTGVCYPLSFLYVLLPLPWSLNYFCLGHLLLAGLGMYLLARHWTGNPFAATVAGLGYALNGLAINCLMWTSNLAALAWLPFVILWVSRGWKEGGRTFLLGAGAATMQMLAGAPEIVLVAWVLLGSLFVLELFCPAERLDPLGPYAPTLHGPRSHRLRAARRFAGIGLLVLGLSAIQLLPFFQLLAHSDRTNSDANAAWALPLSGLANFFVPLFHCTKTILGNYIQVNQQWTSSYYAGIGILLLALIATLNVSEPRVRWLTGVAIFSVLLALGNSAFLYPLLARVVPFFSSIRYPIKFVAAAVFALPLVAAYAIAALPKWDSRALLKRLAIPAFFVIGLTTAALIIARCSPAPDEAWLTTLISGLSRLLLLVLIAVALLYTQRSDVSRSTLPRSHAPLSLPAFAVLTLLGIDAITHNPGQNLTVPNSAYGPMPFSMASVPTLGHARAMVSPQAQAVLDRASLPDAFKYYVGNRQALFQDCNLIDDIPKLNSFFSLHLHEFADIKNVIYQPTNYPSGLIDFLGAAQLTSDDNFWQWTSRPSALPLITGGQKVIVSDERERIAALAGREFPARDVVYLDRSDAPFITATNPTRITVEQKRFEAQRIEASVTADAAGMVVISQNHYPGWKAFVDNKPARLFRANHAFQCVEIPSGTHQVLLVYKDTWFRIGAAITGCSALLFGFMWLRFGARRATNPC